MNQHRDGTQPTLGDEWKDPDTGMVFVWIPPGHFTMGSNTNDRAEYPAHEVDISQGFWLGKYPVTQAEWQKLMGNNPAKFSQYGSDYPVEQVSWQDTQDFVRKLNARSRGIFRLPTEAEWEYACRAGHTDNYGFEGSKENLPDYAWFTISSLSGEYDTTIGVGRKKPNDWGLYDMLGNVEEWVGDWYHNYTHDAWIDPQGPDSTTGGRTTRGGSFADVSASLRSTMRDFVPENVRLFRIGFRVLRQSESAPTVRTQKRTFIPNPELSGIVAGPRPAPGNKAGKEWIEPVTGMAFVWIPPGRFFMGLQHWQDKFCRVTLTRGFWLGKYPVTESQWRFLMRGFPENGTPWDRHQCYRNGTYGKEGDVNAYDDYPINYVTWWDAKHYIDEMNRYCGGGFRLPTEAEWEFSCRANPVSEWDFRPEAIKEKLWKMRMKEFSRSLGFGQTKYLEELKSYARWGIDELGTWPVGQRKPNEWNLYDMLSLMNEWVQDWYGAELPENAVDPVGPERANIGVKTPDRWSNSDLAAACERVLRGCSNRESIPTPSMREGFDCRYYRSVSGRVGFRVAREP